MQTAVLLAAAALLTGTLSAQTPPTLRLPDDVRPTGYDLILHLSPAQDSFTGTVRIDVRAARPVQTIWLHSRKLKIESAKAGGVASAVSYHEPDFLALTLPKPLPAGKASVELAFSGSYSLNDVEGLFLQAEGGNRYVFTQFEPTAARNAFPCFDEPKYKVPWRLTLHVPTGQRAYANTPVESERTEGATRIVRFRQTKPLPSYLVAMAVGPFDEVDGGKVGRNGVPARVITLKGRAAEAELVNKATPRIVAELENFFGMPYPYEKLDQISIPITTGFTAMENAGLITYAQTTLLARPNEDSISRQRTALSTVTHELAHQWFGNAVTPMWWDDIWLNEAFATWMANKIVDGIYPEWKKPVAAVENKAKVMLHDQLVSARRIRQPIQTPGDVGDAFDGITYQKGGAVIRMFENYVGEDKFRAGVRRYMKKHLWGNATTNDFLDSISAAAGQDVTPAFSKFLDRPGAPLLKVDLQCGTAPELRISQERSLPLGSTGSPKEYWPVPACLRWEADGKTGRRCVLLSDPSQTVALDGAKSCPAWVTANDGASGYYHVVYEGDLGTKLTANAGKLTTAEKVDLLRNASAMTTSGRMPLAQALGLARTFAGAPEREVVSAAIELAASLSRVVPAESRPAWASLVRSLFSERARAIGWTPRPSESDDQRLLRTSLLGFVSADGADPVLGAEARRLAEAWIKDRRAIEPELVTTVLSVAAYHGDRALFDAMLTALKGSKQRIERGRILHAIGSFRQPEPAQKALGLLLTDELDIRETRLLLAYFLEEPETRELPYRFVKQHYTALAPRMPSRLGMDGASQLPDTARGLCSQQGIEDATAFFTPRMEKVSGGPQQLAKALESARLCVARAAAQTTEMKQLLQQHAKATD